MFVLYYCKQILPQIYLFGAQYKTNPYFFFVWKETSIYTEFTRVLVQCQRSDNETKSFKNKIKLKTCDCDYKN